MLDNRKSFLVARISAQVRMGEMCSGLAFGVLLTPH